MKVKDVIAELQKMPPDLPVYVVADHGQQLIRCGQVSHDHVKELSYYAEIAWNEDGNNQDKDAPAICTIGD